MRYCIRNYTKLKQVISTNVLSKIATKYMANYYTKKFFFENHLDFLLIFQLTCKESLKEMTDLIKTNKKVREYIPEVSCKSAN